MITDAATALLIIVIEKKTDIKIQKRERLAIRVIRKRIMIVSKFKLKKLIPKMPIYISLIKIVFTKIKKDQASNNKNHSNSISINLEN